MIDRNEPLLVLDGRPETRRKTVRAVVDHRKVLVAMARTDFQVNYKRAVLGLVWAVAIPLIQAAVLAIIFSKVASFTIPGLSVGAYVLTGVLPWAYFAGTLGAGATAIVDRSTLADKVWFPRLVLPLAPVLANLIQLGISMVLMIALLPVLGSPLSARLLLLIPAIALLVAFTSALAATLAVCHVYFRDIRHLVQAAILLWFYATPIFYPATQLPAWIRAFLDFNPMSGVIILFRMATVGRVDYWHRALTVSIGSTIVLLVIVVELYRRLDRLVVDRL